MKKYLLFIPLICLSTLWGCKDDNEDLQNSKGYRTDEDRIGASYVHSVIYFTIKNLENNVVPFERYVIDGNGKEIQVYYNPLKNDNPMREYTLENIWGTNDVEVTFYCSTPLTDTKDYTSIDILKFKSGRIDTIRTVFDYFVDETIKIGGSSLLLKQAWYNGKLFYDNYSQTDFFDVNP